MTSLALETRGASSTTSDLLAATGRVLLAAIFVLSGVSKLADPTGTIAYITSAGLPAPSLAYGAAVAVELVGGLLLIAGIRTRIVASAIAAFSLAAAARSFVIGALLPVAFFMFAQRLSPSPIAPHPGVSDRFNPRTSPAIHAER